MAYFFHSEETDFQLHEPVTFQNWFDRTLQTENCHPGDITFIFCTDTYLLAINRQYLQRNTFTDVIAFNYSEPPKISGDIFISMERVQENAEKYAVSFYNELCRVMIHGILHLIGYDDQTPADKKIMTAKEDDYLQKINIESHSNKNQIKNNITMELNNIRLLVTNFDACFLFYRDVLQLTPTWGDVGSSYASFNLGLQSVLSLFDSDAMADAVHNSNLKYPENVRDKFVINIKTKNVDTLYEQLRQKDVEFINPPQDKTGWGIRAAHFRDPANNLIEIWSELPKESWDKDLLSDAKKFEG